MVQLQQCRWTLSVVVALLGCTACDGWVEVDGVVYESPQATRAKSEMFIDNDRTTTIDIADFLPVAGAEIILEPWPPSGRARNADNTMWIIEGASGADGQFRIGGTTAPFDGDMTLTVRADGFQAVEGVFLHAPRNGNFGHDAVIILVRSSTTQSRRITTP